MKEIQTQQAYLHKLENEWKLKEAKILVEIKTKRGRNATTVGTRERQIAAVTSSKRCCYSNSSCESI